MAFIETIQEADPQENAEGDFLDEEDGGDNNQVVQPEQMTPTPVQDDEVQQEDQGNVAPPPPPPNQEPDNNYAGVQGPSSYWMAFAQRLDTDGPHSETLWNTGDWELPQGCLRAYQGDQVTIRLPDDFPPPNRIFLRVVSCWENEFHKSSVPGPQYQLSMIGRLSYRSKPDADYVAHLIFRTTAWSGGLVPRFNVGRKSFHLVTGDVVEAFLKSDADVPLKSAIVRSWWPSTCQEWMATDPDSYWSPHDISWEFAKIYMLPRIAHDQLRPGNYKFEYTQALMNYPTAFENVAQSVMKGHYGKNTKSPPKGPPSDAVGKDAAKTAVPYPVFKGEVKGPSTDEWGKKGGRWFETASSPVQPSWEYRRPIGYQEGAWQEDGQYKSESRWSPSWTAKGWVDYRSDKGYYSW